MTDFLKKIYKIIISKDKCFEEHQRNGVCNGLSGGDWFTDYLDWGCVNCLHLTMILLHEVKED